MSNSLILYGESFSPWTKKARWALEYCDVPYEYREYIPTLSEPGLRFKLRQLGGSISVPLLITPDHVLRDSWDIAVFANDLAGDNRLGDMESIESWNQISEAALAEGRTRVVRAILGNNKALEEGMPKFIPAFLRRPMRFIAKDAVKRLDKKYAHLLKSNSLRSALDTLREKLNLVDSDYLLGEFSYADITMAVILEVIAPIAIVEPPQGPETVKIWHNSELADEYQDLIEWRDRLAANKAISYSQFNFDDKD